MGTTTNDETVMIPSRRGYREKPCAPVSIMAGAEVDHCRLCRLAVPVAGSSQKAHNARILQLSHRGQAVTVAGPVLGAPQAVLLLEKLVALGSRVFLFFGWCGSLQASLKIGNWLIPSGARSEEGTSVHYPLTADRYLPEAVLCSRLQNYCSLRGQSFQPGIVWTTDAPLRETVGKVRAYGARGVLGVDMESSALFRVAAYRNVSLAALLVVSDELFSLKWHSGFRSSRFRKSCQQAASLLLDFGASLAAEAG